MEESHNKKYESLNVTLRCCQEKNAALEVEVMSLKDSIEDAEQINRELKKEQNKVKKMKKKMEEDELCVRNRQKIGRINEKQN